MVTQCPVSRRILLVPVWTLAKVGRYLQDREKHPPNQVEAALQAQGHTYLQEAQALVEGMSLPSDALGFGQIGN